MTLCKQKNVTNNNERRKKITVQAWEEKIQLTKQGILQNSHVGTHEPPGMNMDSLTSRV